MIPDIIGNTLVIMVIILAIIAVSYWVWRGITKDHEPEPETYGDDGGRPPAPEIGSGLQAGDMEPGSWPAYGLKRLDGHKRGRVEVTGKGGK